MTLAMHHHQTLGPVVRRLREMALSGCSPTQMREYLWAKTPGDIWSAFSYLSEAFLQMSMQFAARMTRRELFPALEADIMEIIMERRAEWEAQPFPELMRLQDYFAFSRFAIEQKMTIFVCGANRHAGAYVGRDGFQCYDGPTFVISREELPHLGLLAADPADTRLQAALRAFPNPLAYDDYRRQLAMHGLRVLGPEDGYVLESPTGARLYEGYRLHGVYDDDTGESAWRAGHGDRLRGLLNRHLGDELVPFGPHDDWEYRNDARIAGPLRGPRFPVIAFESDGTIDNHMTPDDLRSSWHYGDRWATRYDSLPAPAPPEED